jgi:hypothetical protein
VLDVSALHEEVLEETRTLGIRTLPAPGRPDAGGPDATGDLAYRELGLKAPLEACRRRVADAMDGVAAEGSDLLERFNAVAAGLDAAGARLEERNPAAAVASQAEVLASMNSLAGALMERSGQSGAQGEGGMPGEGEGEGEAFDTLDSLASWQERLNQGLERLLGQVGSGGLSAEQEAYMKSLAYEQERIRQGLEGLARKEIAEKMLGDLGGAAAEMKEIEEELKKLRADDRVRKKQEQVLKRMLAAKKSLQQRGQKEERKSETGGEYVVKGPAEIPEELLRRGPAPGYEARPGETPPADYGTLVEDYFRVLRERGKTGPPGRSAGEPLDGGGEAR